MVEDISVDVVVLGAGVAGLMAAYRAQQQGASVLLLGGTAGASNRISSMNTALDTEPADTADGLIDDIMRAGGNVNNPALVSAIAERIGPETRHLADLGVAFVRNGNELARRQTAGSTWTRSVFSKRHVGVDIARALVRQLTAADQPIVQHVKGGLAVRLEATEGRVSGVVAYARRDQSWLRVSTSAAVLATGGAGQLFRRTTNPRGSQGVGYALALELGAELCDMEFVSFEPFVPARPNNSTSLPTPVLRNGAVLRNGLGDEFIDTSRPMTKDVISRAMVTEVREGRGTPTGAVVWDLRRVSEDIIRQYPHLTHALESRGIALDKAQLEVMPAAHYLMGGVRSDATGATTVPGLFVAGEAAGGTHGAHRLAGAGGMEAVAGGSIAGEHAGRFALEHPGMATLPAADDADSLEEYRLPETKRGLLDIRSALDEGCGILRTAADLEVAVQRLSEVAERAAQARNRTLRRSAWVGQAVASAAQRRTESRGDHYRIDYPSRDDARWLGNVIVTLSQGELELTFERPDPAVASPARSG